MSASDRYRGEDGGLYGEGRNEPPAALRARAAAAASAIGPLDEDGRPSPGGKVVLLSVGMSNTSDEFRTFAKLAAADPRVSARVVPVDGAQHGRESADWAEDRRGAAEVWDTVDRRIAAAGCTGAQVQAAWIKHARRDPRALGEFPAHAGALRRDLEEIVRRLGRRFPALRLAFLSSRAYAGFAAPEDATSPEPYAYESAFAVRALVRATARASPASRPVLLWGPYLWADGARPRAGDGLAWQPEDFREDGVHPSPRGRSKVAEALLRTLSADPAARPWFLAR
jgi:hypothetical protein